MGEHGEHTSVGAGVDLESELEEAAAGVGLDGSGREPEPASTAALAGRSNACCSQSPVTVAVLGIDGTILAETFTQAGSQGEQAPFEASVGDGGEAAWFVLIGEGDASGEGRLTWAAVDPIGAG